MRLVDAHFHLDLHKDPVAIVAKCESDRIYTIAVTNAPSVYPHTQALVADCKYVRAALGLHPELVATHAHELPDLLRLLPQARFVGEIGLDYVTADTAVRAAQRRVFEAALAGCASAGGKILTIHSRRSAADVVACIGSSFPGKLILHWFSGSVRDLRLALAAGCYFSVNPAMLKSDRGLKLVQEIPRNRVLTETDGPFVDIDGRKAVPGDAIHAVAGLAALWNVELEEAGEQILATLRDVVT